MLAAREILPRADEQYKNDSEAIVMSSVKMKRL